MGLLGNLITKGVTTAARNATIKAVGTAAATVIESTAKHAPKDVVVIKNGVTHIKPTRSSNEYCGEYALDIAHELLGVGFESVTLKPIHRLGANSKKRYGEVSTVTINGKDDFHGIKKIPVSSHIVIKYLDFKANVSLDVYENVNRITSGVMYRGSKSGPTAQSHSIKYCCYCGTPVQNEDAKFCFNCGKEI